MKKSLIVLAVLLLTVSFAAAQVRTGTLYGKVTDTEKTPLPGVTVTILSNILAPLKTITSVQGTFRFPSLSPADDYQITAELTGFKKAQKTGIIMTIGASVEIDLTLEMGTIEEQVTVIAVTPVIDSKKTTVGATVGKEAMQSLPTARDPWVIMQLAPAIMVDRENVGGNESGQQSGFIGKGDTSGARISGNQGANNTWSVDGIDLTDPAALGGSAGYYDFDMFEELQIQTGGAADVTIQTGGIALNMVTRRGGNRTSLAGRFYLTDNYFQATNLTDDLKAKGVTNVNKIENIKDFGFNAGGPIIKDKVWWWGAYGVQDIFVYTITGNMDKSLLNNYNFKINAQLLANNRFEALLTSGAKEKYGRDSNLEQPEGNHQTGKYHWGSPIVKLQDEHVIGNNFFLSLKYSFNDAGFGWRPMTDPNTEYPIVYSESQAKYVAYKSGMNASWGSYGVSRPRNNAQVQATYFNDSFLGMSHEIKVGAEYSHKVQATEASGTGNIQGFNIRKDYTTLQLDANADGTRTTGEMAGWQRVSLYRRTGSASTADQYAAYIQDTITKGNFTLQLGLRFDKQVTGMGAYKNDAVLPGTKAWDAVFASEVSAVLDNQLTDVSVNAVKGIDQIVNGDNRPYQWNTFSPRIGLTWDIFGNGKTVAKLSYSSYGDIMGVGWYAATPYGTGGTINYWWKDANADNKMTFSEMYWAYSSRQPVGTRQVPYRVYDDAGNFSATAMAMLSGATITDSDAYYYGNVSGYDILNPNTPPDYKRGVTTYFQDRDAQSSSRTREILLTLERELLPDLSVQLNASYRIFDKDQIGMYYYPAEHSADYPNYTGPEVIDPRTPPPGGWFVEVGKIPATYQIGGTWALVGGHWVNTGGKTYSSGDAAGRPYYLPGPNMPTTSTRYRLIRKADNYYTYKGLDLVLNKRLSHKWYMNASITLQAQNSYGGSDFFNATNRWAFEGKPYGDWGGGASGKVAVLMYTTWMVKISGLYQLPWGFNISGTFNAREGWKIPNYFTIDNTDAPNYSAIFDGHAVVVYKQNAVNDSLPLFYNLTLRLEKLISVGSAGRLYLMIDAFNLLNSNMPIRSYSKRDGTDYIRNVAGAPEQSSSYTYPLNGVLNEILNPRVLRIGARFEF
ncbi:MAG: TonB-dependent receptor [Candidatus Aminicenantes bacterium]|nr:TonB-dependent receptor [Candidatus Aminicenantes bacterium]